MKLLYIPKSLPLVLADRAIRRHLGPNGHVVSFKTQGSSIRIEYENDPVKRC